MTLKFDHLVHFTNEPEDAQNHFQSLGFNAFQGGKHPNWGTYNSLCYFHDLGYIEWIGFTDIEVAKTSDNVLIQQIVVDSNNGEGFSTLAFRTDDISRLKLELNQRGFETVGPVPGSRKREDGSIISWSMLFIKEMTIDIRYPFFIQWGQSDEVRKTDLQAATQHKNGAPTISYVSFRVKNIQEVTEKYCLLLGLDLSTVVEARDESGEYFEIAVGGVTLRLYNGETVRPFICGISGTEEEKFVKINGGNYKFEK